MSPRPAPETTKILIDTDIGDDIDDALALAYALQSPELELLAVTTVFRHAGKRAGIARQLLDAWGRADIPVAAGLSGGMLGPRRPTILGLERDEARPPCYGLDAPENPFLEGDAIDLMWQTAKAYPRQLVIVAIGPLTNLGLALASHPALAGLLKGIVLMGGSYFQGCVEWNFACDPEAAQTVFASGAAITAAGLEVTLPLQLDAADTRRLSAMEGPGRELLARWLAQWQQNDGRRLPVLHDVAAVELAFREAFVTLEPVSAQVELEGGGLRGAVHNLGQTFWFYPQENRPKPNLLAGRAIDADALLREFMTRVTAKERM